MTIDDVLSRTWKSQQLGSASELQARLAIIDTFVKEAQSREESLTIRIRSLPITEDTAHERVQFIRERTLLKQARQARKVIARELDRRGHPVHERLGNGITQ